MVIEEVGEEMERRDPKGTKKRVVVTDGERAIQKRVRSRLKPMILILRPLACHGETLEKGSLMPSTPRGAKRQKNGL